MMLAVTSTTSEKTADTVSVSEQVFGRETFNEALVHQVVTALMAGLRQGSKAQKSRGERRGGGRKPWRQKGTGRARAGSIRSPIWRGGGVTFAAKPKSYSQKINKKMYRGALQSVLSELVRQERIKIVDTMSIERPKTKELVAKLKDIGVEKALIVTDYFDENLYLASRNVPNVFVIDAEMLSPLDCVRYDNVIMTVGALKKVEEVVA